MFFASGSKFLREPPVGPEGVRSTERSEPRKVATRSEAQGHALIFLIFPLNKYPKKGHAYGICHKKRV